MKKHIRIQGRLQGLWKSCTSLIFPVFCLLLYSRCNLNEGKRSYEQTCGNCHMEKGQGLEKLIPGFKSTSFQLERSKMICLVIRGVNDSIHGSFMPAYEFMNDAQISNILNYIVGLKDFDTAPFTDKEVIKARENCQ